MFGENTAKKGLKLSRILLTIQKEMFTKFLQLWWEKRNHPEINEKTI